MKHKIYTQYIIIVDGQDKKSANNLKKIFYEREEKNKITKKIFFEYPREGHIINTYTKLETSTTQIRHILQ